MLLMKLGAKTRCHQRSDRSFFAYGFQFPLCARCTGILIGQVAALLLLPIYWGADMRRLLIFAAVCTAIMGVDGVGQLVGKWESTNVRRVVTGFLCGVGLTAVVVRAIIWITCIVGKNIL